MVKLFGKNKTDNKTIYYLFGIKITFSKKSKEHLQKAIKEPIIPEYYHLINSNNFGYKEKSWFLARKCFRVLGYFPNYKNPQTFNEKLQWMNLNYFNPIEEIANDKIDFKDYIKEKLGDGYTAKIHGVYDSVFDIDFESLPNQFVIKNTLSGDDTGVKIVKDKTKINKDEFLYEVNNMAQDWTSGYYSSLNRNSNKKVRILIEEFLGELDEYLNDYKFMCFNGKFKLGYVDVRTPNEAGKVYYFDTDWKLLPINYKNRRGKEIYFPKKPKLFNKMVEISEKLAKDFPLVRVDFYIVKDKLYLGELTFVPGGGFGKYNDDWDLKLGKLLDLSKIDAKYIINKNS
jgi:hypothetical protein